MMTRVITWIFINSPYLWFPKFFMKIAIFWKIAEIIYGGFVKIQEFILVINFAILRLKYESFEISGNSAVLDNFLRTK